MAIHFYGPVSTGAFADMVDELGRAGVSCNQASPNLVRCTWRGARFTIVRDDEILRAQLLDDAGLGAHAWDVIDPILSRASMQRTGFADRERVGAFFYDADLAKFGNAFSPFVQTDSVVRANLALQRPFEDRYNPRYDNQPTWADWMGWNPMELGSLSGDSRDEEWMGMSENGEPFGEEWVGASGPQIAPDARGFEVVDRRALLTTGIIAGITTLFALNHKEHWLEIAAVGVGGIALTWGLSAGAKSTITSR